MRGARGRWRDMPNRLHSYPGAVQCMSSPVYCCKRTDETDQLLMMLLCVKPRAMRYVRGADNGVSLSWKADDAVCTRPSSSPV